MKKVTKKKGPRVFRGVELSHPEVEASVDAGDVGRPYNRRSSKVSANRYALVQTGVGVYPGSPKVWVPADKHIYQFEVEILKRQQKCSHRKGEAWLAATPATPGNERMPRAIFPLPPFRFDFNVVQHSFVDGHSEIWCLTCKRKWRDRDADWDEAVKMVLNSTNRPSATERIVTVPKGPDFFNSAIVTYQDKL